MKEVRKEKKEVRTDEIVVRFKNNGRHRKQYCRPKELRYRISAGSY